MGPCRGEVSPLAPGNQFKSTNERARRCLSLFPLFVVGLGTWIQAGRAPAKRLAVVAMLVAANWLFLLQYEVFMKGYRTLSPYPNGWFNLVVARFVVPFRLIARWLH